jgi:hypothetical protein
VFFNGRLSYCVRKDPVVAVGDDPFAFRPDDHPNPRLCDPSDEDVLVANATLDALRPHSSAPLFVARIDVVTYEDKTCLAEASIDDPFLFLHQAPARAVVDYVNAALTCAKRK